MELPINHFKRALKACIPQVGLWSSLADAYATEVIAGAGFDWIMLDTEHAPNDVCKVLAQLQALAAYSTSAVVRPDWNDSVLIKRYLDIGAQTLLLPYVQSADEATAAVRAVRYPPEGVRGAGGATVRATRFGRVQDYMRRCNEEICLLVQVESRDALERIDEIATVEGVDGVFIGPADLSSSMGHPGNPAHPDVVAAIDHGISRIRAAGKAPGILMTDEMRAHRYFDAGVLFVAVGIDLTLLARQADALARRFKPAGASLPQAVTGSY